MRIWDLNPSVLCRQHLLGEHRELHGLWNILKDGKKGYSQHPETKRWVGRPCHLVMRHEALVEEMKRRGWNHKSPLECIPDYDYTMESPPTLLHTIEEQIEILREKGCDCRV